MTGKSPLSGCTMQSRQTRLVSVVAPVHNNAPELPQLIAEIQAALRPYRVEIVLVEDGSTDASWAVIRQEKARYGKRCTVRGIRLSRNFGQHRAICAGLNAARGDYIFVLDADLQDDPAFMPEMLKLAMSGYHVVHARRRTGILNLRNLASKIVYLIVTSASEIPLHPGMGNYKLLSRQALHAALQFQTYEPLFELMVAQAGFTPGFVDVIRRNRPGTASAYSLLAALGFILRLLVNYSSLFFLAMIMIGVLFTCGAPILLWLAKEAKDCVPLAVSSVFIATGLLLVAAGILGYYIRNLQLSNRNWPLYIIEQTI
jgi:dolichol-phosphate mannosyltransferase